MRIGSLSTNQRLLSKGGRLARAIGEQRPNRAHVTTVLIVDADLGFVFWLGRVLDVAGYAAFPARSVPDAVALFAECKLPVDVLIVDPSLPGAFDFVAALRDDRASIKVVAVSAGAAAHGSRLEADAACEKPAETSEKCLFEWTGILRRTLSELSGSTRSCFSRRG